MSSDFSRGMTHGIPIALGYLSVSFGFGITAAASGLSVFEASAISATNLTSAGQAAGIDVLASGGTIHEMKLHQLTIKNRNS
ncbi:MAG: AzlC family ABC transporter permease, partial [Ruminococcus sp.]|nr:AzlC family ABC transporter permease [Ruminococcus sp.]